MRIAFCCAYKWLENCFKVVHGAAAEKVDECFGA